MNSYKWLMKRGNIAIRTGVSLRAVTCHLHFFHKPKKKKKQYQITPAKCVVYVTFTRTDSAFGPARIMHDIAVPIKVAGDKPKIGGDYIFKTPNNSWTSSASC